MGRTSTTSAEQGGKVVISSTNASSIYTDSNGGTFAFDVPAGNINSSLLQLGVGSTIEVQGDPGTVSNVDYGSLTFNGTLSITTSAGTFTFDGVEYGAFDTSNKLPASYSVGYDSDLGLVKITFSDTPAGPDIFSDADPVGGPYLWSDTANWSSASIPAESDAVQLAGSGIDDLASKSLDSLNLNGQSLQVTGSLSVEDLASNEGSLTAQGSAAFVTVYADANGPVNLAADGRHHHRQEFD